MNTILPSPTVSFTDEIAAGADYSLSVSDVNPDGTPIDLSGCTARFQMRRTAGDSEVAVDLSSSPANGLTITPEVGKIDLVIPAATTATLSGTYVGHLEVSWPTGQVDRLFEATLTISPEVVR